MIENLNQRQTKEVNVNLFRIRELLGWLGMLLPFILLGGNAIIIKTLDKDLPILLNSISHYHYSYVGIVFTGILMAFALLLVSYKGENDGSYWLSDNSITNLAGFFAVVVVLIPTDYDSGLLKTPNTHCEPYLMYIHLGCAGAFLALLGALSFFKFSKSRYNKALFKFCGIMVWVCILVLGIGFKLGAATDTSFVFWLEAVALIFFGFSWLLKGKAKILNVVKVVSDQEYNEKLFEMNPYKIQQ
ncbi:MAG: hypothetical protein AB8B74_12170 [Crocinitomicaceae bacterium]